MSHPRVHSARGKGASWIHTKIAAGWVLVDRTTRRGNPFPVSEYGKAAMRFFMHWLENDAIGKCCDYMARRDLREKHLICWCAPGPCHGEVLARRADGESFEAIRRTVLLDVGETRELFPSP